jgi:hypothetical protein
VGWELGNKKRVTISTFKGKTYVGLREYYEKDGKVLLAPLGFDVGGSDGSCYRGRRDSI